MESFDYGPHIRALEDIEHREVVRKTGAFRTLPVTEPRADGAKDGVLEPPELHDTGPFIYKFGDHETIIWPLYTRRDSVSVVKIFMPKGCIYPIHKHGEVEMIMVYEGGAIYRSESLLKKKIGHRELRVGECVRVCQGIPHEFEATEDTWLIVATIPNSPAFPVRQCKSCSELIVDLEGGEDAP
jgi:quercetin dioxygenase-like cupin family protein